MNCKICNSKIKELLQFGNQPVCHKFLSRPESENKFQVALSICEFCATVQLSKAFPLNEIIPIYDWVTYNEPEDHLDEIADFISQTISSNSKICGVSFKDDTLLKRLENSGFRNQIRIKLEDLGKETGGVETVQYCLTHKKAENIVKINGKFDLIIARHILEHAYNIQEFVDILKSMLTDNGIIVFEVPDYTKSIEMLDYSSIWEEHLVYFTPATIQLFLSKNGLKINHLKVCPYPSENVIVIFTQKGESEYSIPGKTIIQEIDRAEKFAFKYKTTKENIKKYLSCKTRIAVFGAGHSACFLVNSFELKDQIDYFIDDDINKQGLFMPGSHILIVGSNKLSDIDICILCVSPTAESKIIEKNESLSIKFLSFSPNSDISIFKELLL